MQRAPVVPDETLTWRPAMGVNVLGLRNHLVERFDQRAALRIIHGNGLATRFGHLSEISVKVGQVVRIGEIVGSIGSTGLSTGPHLHYETRVNGQPVDPQKFLRAGLSLGDE